MRPELSLEGQVGGRVCFGECAGGRGYLFAGRQPPIPAWDPQDLSLLSSLLSS